MKFYFDTLGCPKTTVDSERMCFYLQQAGHEMVFSPEEAGVIVVNTCGFIETAKQESIDALLSYAELKQSNSHLKLVVAGCLSERYQQELLKEIPEIDSAIGVRDPQKIIEAVTSSGQRPDYLLDRGDFQDRKSPTERDLVFSGMHYAYLKISEGCDRSCAFCAIPGIRGQQRSRSVEDILSEAEFLLKNDVQELILVGEDLTAYGKDIYGRKALPELLRKLSALDFHWIRLMYLFPDDILPDIAQLMAETPNICKYMDLPLQHASGKILRSMNRPGNSETYLKLITKLRDTVPDLSIRSAFIAGFPGEDEEDMRILAEFLTTARLERVGFFAYSDEEGTPAYDLPGKLSSAVINRRLNRLAQIQEEVSRERLLTKVGRTVECINDGTVIEEAEGEMGLLRTPWDAPEIDGAVFVLWNPDWEEASFLEVEITGLKSSHDWTGEVKRVVE